MIFPTVDGFVAGERVTASKLTRHTKTAFESFVTNKPMCRLAQSTAQNMANSGGQVTFQTVTFDTDVLADLANNRIVIKNDGIYRVTFNLGFAPHATGIRTGSVRVNSSELLGTSMPAASGLAIKFSASDLIRLSAGDLITQWGFQNSGAPLALSYTSSETNLSVEWVGK